MPQRHGEHRETIKEFHDRMLRRCSLASVRVNLQGDITAMVR